MRILLEQIMPAGLEITADLSDVWVVAAAISLRSTPGEPQLDPHGDEPPEAASVRLTLERLGDQVKVGGETAITLVRGCDRCGASVRICLEGPIDMHFNPPGDLIADSDHGLASDELDVGWHDGQAIDLCAVLTEQLSLWAPDVVRCGDPGVIQLKPDEPCTLPDGALEEGTSTRNPFAGLRLPE